MSSPRSDAVVQRYRDAYRVGNTIVGIGWTIKVIGFALAALIFVMSLLGGATLGGQSGAAGMASVLTGGIAAAIVGLIFWLAGVLISSQGQVLLATLDTAVNHSPFLTDDDRATAMALPESSSVPTPNVTPPASRDRAADASEVTPQRRPEIQPGEKTITCPQCGVVNLAAVFYCENCKRNLHM